MIVGLRNRRQEKNSHVCSAKPRIVVESEPSELSQDQKISRSPFLLRKQKEENLFLEPLHVDISSIKSFPSLYSLQCLEESSADVSLIFFWKLFHKKETGFFFAHHHLAYKHFLSAIDSLY